MGSKVNYYNKACVIFHFLNMQADITILYRSTLSSYTSLLEQAGDCTDLSLSVSFLVEYSVDDVLSVILTVLFSAAVAMNILKSNRNLLPRDKQIISRESVHAIVYFRMVNNRWNRRDCFAALKLLV